MTSFSTYGTGRLRLVDGSLSTDLETAEDQLNQIACCVASGAARALLDTTRDDSDMDAEVHAEQWHSADEGWEIGAITENDRPEFMSMCDRFVRANVQNILTLVQRIAWDPRWKAETWHGDEGMATYRVGMLLGYSVHGDGIGFDDYYQPTVINGVVAPQGDLITEPLKAWVDNADNHPYYLDTWIDSAEEPCRLHLH